MIYVLDVLCCGKLSPEFGGKLQVITFSLEIPFFKLSLFHSVPFFDLLGYADLQAL